jgi:hypothetical protein
MKNLGFIKKYTTKALFTCISSVTRHLTFKYLLEMIIPNTEVVVLVLVLGGGGRGIKNFRSN